MGYNTSPLDFHLNSEKDKNQPTLVDSGQQTVGSKQWAVNSGQWAVGSGQWAVGSRQ
jgi:hypothetical protein